LVNNAGFVSFTPIVQPEERGWRWIVDVNLFGVIHGIQTFLPRMLERDGEGHIVNTASLAGVVGGGGLTSNRIRRGDSTPELGAMYGYMATKHAVVSISETLARDLSGSRIRCRCSVRHITEHRHLRELRSLPAGCSRRTMSDEAAGGVRPHRRTAKGTSVGARSTGSRTSAPHESCVPSGRPVLHLHPSRERAVVGHRYAEMLAGSDDADSFAGEVS
jgi:NAD(P)-dependent dehydrogenase (short-subunit alcohol dehydrogenase family)